MPRPLDLVLFGATGFTGGLTARYLADCAPPTLRWAIAGRNAEKLEALRQRLGADPEIRVADVADPASLDRLASDTHVLATTVGPYVRYGTPVVAACAKAGTHYLDITGEPAFVAESRRDWDAVARDSGALLVQCCGFDCIPADLGVLYTVSRLSGAGPKVVHGTVQASGSPSGGTWASLLEALGGSPRPPRSGSGSSGAPRARTPALRWVPELQRWAVKLPVIDPMIVRRSARARPEVYGPDFTYHHMFAVGRKRRMATLGLGAAAVGAAARVPAARRWLAQLRPAGTGPDEDARARGWFRLTLVGRTDDARVVCEVSGGDPGYTETSKMLAECALLLATDRARLPATGGVHTPASALGTAAIDRLQAAGIAFTLRDE